MLVLMNNNETILSYWDKGIIHMDSLYIFPFPSEEVDFKDIKNLVKGVNLISHAKWLPTILNVHLKC